MTNSRRQDIVRWIESLIKSNSDNRLLGHIRSKITWNRIFRVVSYTKSSLWIVPIVAIVLELIAFRVLHVLDAWLLWPFQGRGLQAAETMLQTIITLNLSFMVFTFGSLLVAIQVASGQMTPRIIATDAAAGQRGPVQRGSLCFYPDLRREHDGKDREDGPPASPVLLPGFSDLSASRFFSI